MNERQKQISTIDRVVASGSCVGCGACSVRTGGAIPVRLNDFGVWQANLDTADSAARAAGSIVCPFADESPNETALAEELFPSGLETHPELGRLQGVFTAQVSDEAYLEGSSSGGLTSWILLQLLEQGLIDGVIHVGHSTDELFSYVVSHSHSEVLERRKSAYYSTSMTSAIESVRGNGKKYAVVGVPCFVTAARLLCRADSELSSQLRFFVGLVCGHLKSAAFAELLAWQTGIAPHDLESVDFRVKVQGRDAASYDFSAVGRNGETHHRPTRELLGGNWGHGMFQLDACNYCDDVFAETADVVLGDAWLPEFVHDWRGTNIVVTRNATIQAILEAGSSAGSIHMAPLTPAKAVFSQAGNFRHRRDGLALRLYDDKVEGRWSPTKRVSASNTMPMPRQRIVRARRDLSSSSHTVFREAKKQNRLDYYETHISLALERYTKASRSTLPHRIAGLPARALRLTRRYLRGRIL